MTLKNNFNAGAIGPRLEARVDLARYPNAMAEGINMALYREGGWGRRPGSIFAWEQRNDARCVLQDMRDGLVLELTDGHARFGKNLGRFDVATTTASITNGDFSSGITGWTNRSTGTATATANLADAALAGSYGTATGNFNSAGNAYNGVTGKSASFCAFYSGFQPQLGKRFPASQVVTNVRVFASNDQGFVGSKNPSITWTLWGSNDAFAADAHQLGSATVTDGNGRVVDFARALDISAGYTSFLVKGYADGKQASWYVAQVIFVAKGAATGQCDLKGDGTHAAAIQQQITGLVSGQTHVLRFTLTGQPYDGVTIKLGAAQDGSELALTTRYPGSHSVEFTPTATSAYLLFSTTVAHTVSLSGVALLSNEALDLATPWPDPILEGLQTTPSADVLFVASGAGPLQQIRHFSDGSWAIETTAFDDGPWLDADPDNAIVITPSGVAADASITLTASAPLWSPQHVGALWRLATPSGTFAVEPWTAGGTVQSDGGHDSWSTGQECVNAGHVYQAQNNATSGYIPPTWLSGSHNDKTGGGGVDWLYLNDGYGTVVITAYTSSTSVAARVLKRLPTQTQTSGTKYWREGAFSYARGWPNAVAIYQARLVLADDPSNPGTLWFSATDDYTSFAIGTNADSSLKETLRNSRRGRGDVNKIQWISASGKLIIGTQGGPWAVDLTPQTNDTTTVTAEPQTAAGCAAALPCTAQQLVLYLSRNRRRLYELAYDISSDRFVANDLSVVNAPITGRSGILRMVYQEEPWPVLYCLRNDGKLAVLLYDPQQQIAGWTLWTMGGTDAAVESILSVPGSATAGTDDRDVIYLSVARTIGGVTKRYVEYLDRAWQTGNDRKRSAFVDCAAIYDSIATNVVTGMLWLEGETVRICADGAPRADETISGGSINLDEPASTVVAGFGYEARYKSLKMAPSPSSVGQKKQSVEAVLLLEDSYGGKIGRAAQDGNAELLDDIAYPDAGASDDDYGALFTGELPLGNPGLWGRDPRTVITHDQPVPFNVLGIALRVEGGG